MSEFERLLNELGTLAKAAPPIQEGDVDKRITAAYEDEEDEDEDEKEGDEDNEDKGEYAEGAKPGGKEEVFGKSFSVRLDDDTDVEAYDGTELVKSLMAQHQEQQQMLQKSLTATVAALGAIQKTVQAQGEAIAKLSTRVGRVSGEGSGRKTALTLHDKPVDGFAKAGMADHGELLAKAQAAFDAGKLTAKELNTIDFVLRRGGQIDHTLLAKALI